MFLHCDRPVLVAKNMAGDLLTYCQKQVSQRVLSQHTTRNCPKVSFQIPAVIKLTNVKMLSSPNIYPLVSHLHILNMQSQTAGAGFAFFSPVTPPPTPLPPDSYIANILHWRQGLMCTTFI